MDRIDQAAEQLFGEILELPREQRPAFLDRKCAGQPALRRKLEDLLAENDRLSGFLSESPLQRVNAGAATVGAKSLSPGTRLGRYFILEKVGAGGMGVVYRARDEKLERMVAIKILTPGVLSGEDAHRHFRREALALAKLNHAHIAAVYDADEQDGTNFIAMEFVEGDSLAALLRGGALPLKDATAIALQVAEALEEAHEHGVIHRDLKPGNVMITPKGNAKVLDFGLAKVLAPTADATVSLAETRGVLGTPFYMSPEQTLGRSLDARTDLWSLGVLYFECLTGLRPFTGDSNLAIMQAITALPLPPMPPAVPALAQQIVARATEKDPELRYQRAREFATDLRRMLRDLEPRPLAVFGTTSAPFPVLQPAPPRRWRAVSAAAGAALFALLALAYIFRPTVPPPRLTGMTQLTHDGVAKLLPLTTVPPAMFTDGPRVYFQEIEAARVNVMQVSTLGGESERVPLPFDVAGVMDLSIAQSKALLETPADPSATLGVLWTMPWPAGQPQSIGNLALFDVSWSPDGNSLYYTLGSDLWVARSDESQRRKILSGKGQLQWIRFSHDGQRIRFTALDTTDSVATLWEARADGSHAEPVLPGWNACCGSWTPDGRYFVFAAMRDGSWNLWATREKRDWWRRSDPTPVRLTVGQMSSTSPLPGADGKSIFFIGSTPRGELVRYDLQKRSFLPYLPGISAQDLAFSRDGSRVAWIAVPEGTLWQSQPDGTDRRELTFGQMQASMPRWSPDGSQIAFAGQEPGKPEKIFVVPATGGLPEQVTTGALNDPSWSPRGDALAFGVRDPYDPAREQHLIRILDLKSRTVTPLPASNHYFSPRWSPDGRWLLALEQDTFAMELYNFETRTWEQLGKLGAAYPNWTADSKCVLFNEANSPQAAYDRICLADRKPQHLVNLAEGGARVSPTFDYWTGVTPDGSILGIRDISTEEVYALDVQLP